MKMAMRGVVAVAMGVIAVVTANGQMPAMDSGREKGDKMMVTVDSIETNGAYIVVAIMDNSFSPFDYQVRPSKQGSMTIEMQKPLNDAPYSVMVYEDVNLNMHLDLNEKGVPSEKSAMLHCRGDEYKVVATLKHYDKLLSK